MKYDPPPFLSFLRCDHAPETATASQSQNKSQVLPEAPLEPQIAIRASVQKKPGVFDQEPGMLGVWPGA